MFVPNRKHTYGLQGPLRGERKRGREVDVSKRSRAWEGREFIIGFEGSQPLPVCPSGMFKTFNRYY
jgi:hypothetical protein